MTSCGLSVLVVDDNATNRRILKEILLRWGMRATLADGGEEALFALRSARESGEPVDLVLLDFQMPGMDGFEVAAAIKQKPELAATTIMMLSSVGHRGDAARCRELGVAAYLTKPIRQLTLLDALLAVLTRPADPSKELPPVTRHTLREARLRLRVLVAEDNRINQLVATKMLERFGHSVVVADDGVKALAALRETEFDVVLMDVQMPEMDGLTATAEIRRQERTTGRHLTIIALTAGAKQEEREACYAAGADGFLAKPLHASDLQAALENLELGSPEAESSTLVAHEIPN